VSLGEFEFEGDLGWVGGGDFIMRDARFTHLQRLLGGCGEYTIIARTTDGFRCNL